MRASAPGSEKRSEIEESPEACPNDGKGLISMRELAASNRQLGQGLGK
jgi:hypothetical protein